MSGYLSHHVLPIDESFKPTNRRRIVQWEDVLGLDGGGAPVGVFLEDDDLKRSRCAQQSVSGSDETT